MPQPLVVAGLPCATPQNLGQCPKFWHHATYILQQPLIIAKQKTQAFFCLCLINIICAKFLASYFYTLLL